MHGIIVGKKYSFWCHLIQPNLIFKTMPHFLFILFCLEDLDQKKLCFLCVTHYTFQNVLDTVL